LFRWALKRYKPSWRGTKFQFRRSIAYINQMSMPMNSLSKEFKKGIFLLWRYDRIEKKDSTLSLQGEYL
jgi:hypothetical protein